MWDEADFHAALDANPDDATIRLAFADWLQERDDERAEGYRALGMQGKYAANLGGCLGYWVWLSSKRLANQLPRDWWDAFYRNNVVHIGSFKTRHKCESEIARAFTRLPAARRAELLTPAAVPVV